MKKKVVTTQDTENLWDQETLKIFEIFVGYYESDYISWCSWAQPGLYPFFQLLLEIIIIIASIITIIIASISFPLKSVFVWVINYIVSLVFTNIPPPALPPEKQDTT